MTKVLAAARHAEERDGRGAALDHAVLLGAVQLPLRVLCTAGLGRVRLKGLAQLDLGDALGGGSHRVAGKAAPGARARDRLALVQLVRERDLLVHLRPRARLEQRVHLLDRLGPARRDSQSRVAVALAPPRAGLHVHVPQRPRVERLVEGEADVGRRAVVEEDRLCAPLPVPLGRPVDRGEVVAHQLLRAAAVVFDGALREQP